MIIESGGSPTNLGLVNSEGEQLVKSTSSPLQHIISERDGQNFSVIGDFASLSNATHTILHIRNTSDSKQMFISFVYVQNIDLGGGTAVPSVNTFWEIGKGRTFTSGGTAVTAVNTNLSSGKTPDAIFFDNNPTLGGTFVELDRYYVKEDADSRLFNQMGATVLGKDDTFEVRITTDATSGTALAKVSFFFEETGD